MSTCFAHRPSQPTAPMLQEALATAEQSLDGGATTGALLVSLRRGRPRGGVELSVLPLVDASHPAEVLAGFTAPKSWEAVGCVAAATAHHLDPPPHAVASQRVRFGFLLHRDGTSVASLSGRPQPPAHESCEPPEGRLADVFRRVLGLPTPAAQQGHEAWWAMIWLDRVFAEAVLEPAHRLSWPEAVALHPFSGTGDEFGSAVDHHATTSPGRTFAVRIVEAASTVTWSSIRSAVASGPDALAHVEPDLAAWLDEGSFARTVMEPYLPVPVLLSELAVLLPEGVHAEITAAVRAWGLA